MIHGLSLRKIDHSHGRAFLSGGKIFYSPNCSRRIHVPVYRDHYSYPFHDTDAQYENFLSPGWWTRLYHYLAFITLRPSFDGLVLGCLREFVPHIISYGTKYGLAPEKASQWKDLEDGLLMMAFLINKHYPLQVHGALRPSLPSFLGFGKVYPRHRSARLHIAILRDWFLVWMALLSSKMADLLALDEPEEAKDWFTLLTNDNIPEAWLNSVTSSICNFSQQNPHVRTILNIQKPQTNQPSVQWFMAFNIPVWYSWGPGDPVQLQPPAHLLQDATTFMSKHISQTVAIVPSQASPPCPSSPPRSSSPLRQHNELSEYQVAKNSYVATKPWEKFFADRAERNRRIIAKESDQACMTRLNRKRKPPKVSANVYLWDWSKDGGIELVRTRVSSRLREDTLAEHSDSQSIYDAVSNVWDCCEYFGEPDENEDDDETWEEYMHPQSSSSEIGTSAQDHEAILNERVEEVQRNTIPYTVDLTRFSNRRPETNLEHSPGQVNVHLYLHRYYRFLVPIPFPTSTPINSNNDWGECLKSVSLDAQINNALPGLTDPIVNFIRGMQRASGPQPSEWDLLINNHNPLTEDLISTCLRRLPNDEFLLLKSCLCNDRPRDWHIALTTSANALYVTRWLVNLKTERVTIDEVAQHLAEEGIPFHTYLTLETLPSKISLSGIEAAIPQRSAKYVFTVDDYHTYVSDRNRLLSTPRGRAAILRGGIVGRLARECLATDAVLSGPSSAVVSYRLGCSVKHSEGTFWDDNLTDDELAIICGMFYCYTGNRDQIAKLSWWPLPEYWDQAFNLYNWGHWTEWDEHWYQEHLLKIQDGEVKPLSHNGWRRKLKSAPSWRKVTKTNLDQSDKSCTFLPIA